MEGRRRVEARQRVVVCKPVNQVDENDGRVGVAHEDACCGEWTNELTSVSEMPCARRMRRMSRLR